MDYNPLKYSINELSNLEANEGKILISEPFMEDKYFKRSVVLLCEKNDSGSVGFILNQPLNINLSEVFNEKLGFDSPLFLGGPVEAQSLFFIHTCKDLPDSVPVTTDIFWSGDFEVLKEYILIGKILLHEVKFFLGYSGWDVEQLTNEIKTESWLISKTDTAKILDKNTDSMWKDCLKEMGSKQAVLASFPEDPSLN